MACLDRLGLGCVCVFSCVRRSLRPAAGEKNMGLQFEPGCWYFCFFVVFCGVCSSSSSSSSSPSSPASSSSSFSLLLLLPLFFSFLLALLPPPSLLLSPLPLFFPFFSRFLSSSSSSSSSSSASLSSSSSLFFFFLYHRAASPCLSQAACVGCVHMQVPEVRVEGPPSCLHLHQGPPSMPPSFRLHLHSSHLSGSCCGTLCVFRNVLLCRAQGVLER